MDSTTARINLLEYKIQLLSNRGRENSNIIRKLERELRVLKGIPKLEVKWTWATNVAPYESTSTKATKKK